jgi:hypothetical protein
VRESVVRATCVEKGGRKGVLVKGVGVDGLLRRATSGRSQGWGGVQQWGAPHGGIREGPDRSPRRQAADNGPRAMGEVGVQAAVQNKDTEVAARWGLGNSAGWRRLNLFRIQIQTDFKSNSNCFRLWLTQKKTFLSSKNLK